MKVLTIVKIGGRVVDDQVSLERFLKLFNKIEQPKILVHGGGLQATELSDKLGISLNIIEGRRITNFETLKVCTMVYAGWINKSIVALLQNYGCNSIGLSGADASAVPAKRRPKEPVDYGYVGDVNPVNINVGFITSLLGRGVTPVFSPITYEIGGTLLNINADSMASAIAIAMSRSYYTRLLFCFEKRGVLSDREDDESVIPLVSAAGYQNLKDSGKITEGMIPKIDNAFYSLQHGVPEVFIKHWSELIQPSGTMLKL